MSEQNPNAAETTESAESQPELKQCAYQYSNKTPCCFKAARGRDLCFWHDPDAVKTGPLVGPQLVKLVSENINFEGAELESVDLEYRRLPGAQLISANLGGAKLFRVHLEGAHLFSADLRDASLVKASVAGANLRSANLDGANMLGLVLKGAKLEGANFGKNDVVVNESKGDRLKREGKRDAACRSWREAEEVYLALLNNLRDAGRHTEAGEVFYRLMVVGRKTKPKFTVERWSSSFMDILCGYGERPVRVFFAWLVLIFVSSLFFFFLGISTSVEEELIIDGNVIPILHSETIQFDSNGTWKTNFSIYGKCIYFSVITMTTTGYGDITPSEATRPLAAIEAFVGAFLMAVFVLVFSRKMMR